MPISCGGGAMGQCILKIGIPSESTEKEKRVEFKENRKNARIPVCVAISCVSVDAESKPLDHNMGIVKDVSQAGIGIEANEDVNSDRLILTFVDLNNRIAEITGKVVFSKRNASGTFKIGVLLQGKQPDVIRFVERLVKLYHYTKKIKYVDKDQHQPLRMKERRRQ
jgi:hypothetical protein